MALNKDRMINCGVSCSYHRIESMSVSFNVANGGADMVVQVEIGTYLNAAARALGKAPVSREIVQLGLSNAEPTRGAVYNALKGLNAFAGAIDV